MKRAWQRLVHAWGFAFGLLLLIWACFGLQQVFGLMPGIVPRSGAGLVMLPFAFLFHANAAHLLANSAALLILAGLFALRCRHWQESTWLTLLLATLGGLIVWLIGSPGVHLGASLLVFAYFGFLIGGLWGGPPRFGALLWRLLLAAAALYLFWPLLPQLFIVQDGVSWSAHAGGALAGLLLGMRQR